MERQEVQHEGIKDIPYLLYQFGEFDSDVFLLPMMSWVCHDNDLDTAAAAEQQFFCKEGQTN